MSKSKLPWICIAVLLMLTSIGFAQEREQSPDAARARAENATRDALKVMRGADKLTDKQVKELYHIVFPKEIDWDVRYEVFLEENPGVARTVESAKISKEKVIAGIKSREGERPPTEEEQLEALHQRLLKDEPTLGRTPKAALMPRLKAMLERGEGKNLRPEKSTRQRTMSFGLYLNELIESGQVERFDKDLKMVHDLGVGEIGRQGQQPGVGREARPRGVRERGDDRGARDNPRQQADQNARARRRDGDKMRGVRLRLKPKMEALLLPLGEHIGRHCGLDQAAVDTFRATVFESLNTMLEQERLRARGIEYLVADSLTLVEMMLSQPGWRGAFAKCLTEKQLQDYTDFTYTRRQLDQRALRKQVVAWLDRPLSLTVDQRAQVEQAILAATEKSDAKLSSLNVMSATSEVIIQRLPDIRLDGILPPSQTKVWALMAPKSKSDTDLEATWKKLQAMVKKGGLTKEQAEAKMSALKTEAAKKGIKKEAPQRNAAGIRKNDDRRLTQYRAAEAELNRAVEAGRITREQANERMLGLRRQLWTAPDVRREDDADQSEDQTRQLAEAQLAAHTEQLGKLDARAAKRLELAAKGAVEQVLESLDTGQQADPSSPRGADVERAAIRIRAAVAQGRITREQAGERLRAMRERGSEPRQRNATADITGNPLYQQTIKDVLSKEAYARYQARQTESLAFRQQATRDLVVASLDLQLWLGEKQRKRFEQVAAKLPAPATDETDTVRAEMVTKLYEHFSRTDREVLSPWQIQEFQEIRTGGNRRRGR